MLKRRVQTVVARPVDLSPSRDDFEVVGVFNPGVAAMDDQTVMLVRVAERPRNDRRGFTALPRWDPDRRLVVDWLPNDALTPVDPRVVCINKTGRARLTFTSHLRVLRSRDGHRIDTWDGPRFQPQLAWESYGVEDARVTRIGQRWYFTYVAVSPWGVATALASTNDFHTFRRHGIVFCPENKDVVLFPERIGGSYWAVHRPVPATPFSSPELWLARSEDLLGWGDHRRLAGGDAGWEADRIGAGPPPLRIEQGWLLLYHGSRPSRRHGRVGAYCAGAMLLDADRPGDISARSTDRLMHPETDFERTGFVPQVVFPTGIVRVAERLRVYYGAADTCTAMVEFLIDDVLGALA